MMSSDESKIYTIIIFTIIIYILIFVLLASYVIKKEKRKNKLTKLQIEILEKELKKDNEKPIKINNEKIKEKPKIKINKQLLLIKQIENIKKELNKLEYDTPK